MISDADGDTLTVVNISNVSTGTAIITSTASAIQVTPATDSTIPISLTYMVSNDGKGQTSTATIKIGIVGGYNYTEPNFSIEMIRISSGTFMMGSPDTETDRSTTETQHQVTISNDFYLGKYEVTQKGNGRP